MLLKLHVAAPDEAKSQPFDYGTPCCPQEKPVGLDYIPLVSEHGTEVQDLRLSRDRDLIRFRSTQRSDWTPRPPKPPKEGRDQLWKDVASWHRIRDLGRILSTRLGLACPTEPVTER